MDESMNDWRPVKYVAGFWLVVIAVIYLIKPSVTE